MRLVSLLALSLSLTTACDKKTSSESTGSAAPAVAKTEPGKDPAKPATPAKDEPKQEEPKAEQSPKPATKTGILDLELQEVAGGYKVITPRFTQFFPSLPQLQRQDAKTPSGDTIPGGVAIASGGNRFAGLIYIPVPKDTPYDVAKGLKGARDGMLGNMFEGKFTAKDDKAKIGPLDASHVVAEGSRSGQKFHVEAWFAYDPGGRTVYGLMSLRMPTDLEGIDKFPAGFEKRADAAPDMEATEGDKDADGNVAKPAKK